MALRSRARQGETEKREEGFRKRHHERAPPPPAHPPPGIQRFGAGLDETLPSPLRSRAGRPRVSGRPGAR